MAPSSIDDQVRAYVARVHEGRLAKPSCQACGQSGRLRWHGTYLRTLIALAQTHILPVKRVLCALCGRSFAHLPVFIVKFHRYARDLIRQSLRLLKARTYEAVAGWLVEQGRRYVAVLTLHFWRRKFARAGGSGRFGGGIAPRPPNLVRLASDARRRRRAVTSSAPISAVPSASPHPSRHNPLKAKNLIRRAYGFRDDEYMRLKIIQVCTPWIGVFHPWGWAHVHKNLS